MIGRGILVALTLAGAGILPQSSRAQFGESLVVGGYFQGMPVRMQVDMPDPFGAQTYVEYRLQNRLNVRWHASRNVNFTLETRTRLFAGDLVEVPGYAAAIDSDPGFVNLSRMLVERDDWLLHLIPDRLYGEWVTPEWSVRAGRQRINWGINLMTNPNDLFNIYSFYDFDYPERPGADAVRIQRFLDHASRVEIAVSPAREPENSVAAALYAFNAGGYDVQLIAGYYRNRLAAGGGWAGSIGQAGFKGEATFFSAGESMGRTHPANLVAAVSGDYVFPGGLFLVAEGLYNHRGGRDRFLVIGTPFAPDNPSFSRYQTTSQISYPFHPLLNGALAAGWYPDERAVFLSPSMTFSVAENLDLRLLAQLFSGPRDSPFGRRTSVLAGSLRWDF
jgi:hypothetical protein